MDYIHEKEENEYLRSLRKAHYVNSKRIKIRSKRTLLLMSRLNLSGFESAHEGFVVHWNKSLILFQVSTLTFDEKPRS